MKQSDGGLAKAEYKSTVNVPPLRNGHVCDPQSSEEEEENVYGGKG